MVVTLYLYMTLFPYTTDKTRGLLCLLVFVSFTPAIIYKAKTSLSHVCLCAMRNSKRSYEPHHNTIGVLVCSSARERERRREGGGEEEREMRGEERGNKTQDREVVPERDKRSIMSVYSLQM